MRDIAKHSRWLGITPQQCRILEALMALNKEGAKAGPGDIMRRESKMSGSPPIQKSNFFGQLKSLQDRGYVRKVDDASYSVDLKAMARALGDAGEGARREAEDLAKAASEAEEYLSAHLGSDELEATFLSYDHMQERFADMLLQSKNCYITSLFPKLLYAHSPVFTNPKSGRLYAERLWDGCIKCGRLRITYLTRLDVDYLFSRLALACGDSALAAQEAGKVIRTLETLLDKHDNLRIFYSPSPYGIDIGIPDVNKMRDFFLFFRNQEKDGIGAVYLNNPQLALKFRNLFRQECEGSIDLRSDAGRAVIDKAKAALEDIKSRL